MAIESVAACDEAESADDSFAIKFFQKSQPTAIITTTTAMILKIPAKPNPF